MRRWWVTLSIVAAFVAAFAIVKLDEEGHIPVGGFQRRVAAPLRGVGAVATDLKFKLRGRLPVRQDIVIVEVDGPSLAMHGRWPWHRDQVARLLQTVLDAGARVVGLDVVFSEADPRAPDGLRQALRERGLDDLGGGFETDPVLAELIRKNAGRLVLGWQTEAPCRPGLESFEGCPVTDAAHWKAIPTSHHRFALQGVTWDKRLQAQRTPLYSAVGVVTNIEPFAAAAERAGFFNAFPDADGVIRDTHPVMLVAGRPHPSLPLAMAAAARGEALRLRVDAAGRIASLAFAGGETVPVSSTGALRVNFLGPGRSFPYVPAHAVLAGQPEALARLRGACVLVGVSALGVHDMRSFPMDANVPGVEGNATILDNLLSERAFRSARDSHEVLVVLLLMTVGALLLALALHRLSARPGLAVFVGGLMALALVDLRVLFAHRVRLDTGLLYLELATLLVVGLGIKYFEEESKKKFIRAAFSHYVPPAVVDSILADPEKLVLGGERKSLSILFSDIRGFTTFAERLDPRRLVAFLNEYLGRMTDIVFAHQGTLDKYIGDAVMAFWGAPLEQPDHAHRALATAVAMIRAVDELKPLVKDRWDIDLEIGVGVASGVVSVGNMGSQRNFEYTAIGDRVNLASRLESLTKTYGARILTTVETLDEIARGGQAAPDHWPIDRVRVKGKSQAVELVEVLVEPVPAEERKAFEEACASYRGRRFREAQEAFAALDAAHHRKRHALFVERCRHFEEHPPPEGWDGEWEMDRK